MKIIKNELVSIESSDIKKGVLVIPKKATSIANEVLFNLPELTKVIAKGVTSIGNYNFRYCNALVSLEIPLVTSIGNYNFYECNALVSLEIPLVTSIGNYNFRYCNALVSLEIPLVTSIGNYNFCYCNALVSLEIQKYKLKTKKVDNTIFVIEAEKTTKGIRIYTGYNLLNFKNNELGKENCIVAEKDGFMAHGDTLKKAIADVQFKIVSEKLKNDPIKESTVITINYYRLITGSCEMGVNNFIDNNFTGKQKTEVIENGITAKKLLPILEKSNAYGIERFKKLLTF